MSKTMTMVFLQALFYKQAEKSILKSLKSNKIEVCGWLGTFPGVFLGVECRHEDRTALGSRCSLPFFGRGVVVGLQYIKTRSF